MIFSTMYNVGNANNSAILQILNLSPLYTFQINLSFCLSILDDQNLINLFAFWIRSTLDFEYIQAKRDVTNNMQKTNKRQYPDITPNQEQGVARVQQYHLQTDCFGRYIVQNCVLNLINFGNQLEALHKNNIVNNIYTLTQI